MSCHVYDICVHMYIYICNALHIWSYMYKYSYINVHTKWSEGFLAWTTRCVVALKCRPRCCTCPECSWAATGCFFWCHVCMPSLPSFPGWFGINCARDRQSWDGKHVIPDLRFASHNFTGSTVSLMSHFVVQFEFAAAFAGLLGLGRRRVKADSCQVFSFTLCTTCVTVQNPVMSLLEFVHSAKYAQNPFKIKFDGNFHCNQHRNLGQSINCVYLKACVSTGASRCVARGENAAAETSQNRARHEVVSSMVGRETFLSEKKKHRIFTVFHSFSRANCNFQIHPFARLHGFNGFNGSESGINCWHLSGTKQSIHNTISRKTSQNQSCSKRGSNCEIDQFFKILFLQIDDHKEKNDSWFSCFNIFLIALLLHRAARHQVVLASSPPRQSPDRRTAYSKI